MQPVPFETSSVEVDGVRVIAVRGELDLSTAPDLEGPLDAAVDDQDGAVLIDLAECEFIDSSGIALIVRGWKKLVGDGGSGRFAICSPNEQVRRVLDISGLDHSIPVHLSRDEAVSALRG